MFFHSAALRNYLWSCHHHHSADDFGHCQIPRHVKQCQRVHEASRSAKSAIRAGYGLCGVHVGNDQGLGHG
jgi:hypothetical protein